MYADESILDILFDLNNNNTNCYQNGCNGKRSRKSIDDDNNDDDDVDTNNGDLANVKHQQNINTDDCNDADDEVSSTGDDEDDSEEIVDIVVDHVATRSIKNKTANTLAINGNNNQNVNGDNDDSDKENQNTTNYLNDVLMPTKTKSAKNLAASSKCCSSISIRCNHLNNNRLQSQEQTKKHCFNNNEQNFSTPTGNSNGQHQHSSINLNEPGLMDKLNIDQEELYSIIKRILEKCLLHEVGQIGFTFLPLPLHFLLSAGRPVRTFILT